MGAEGDEALRLLLDAEGSLDRRSAMLRSGASKPAGIEIGESLYSQPAFDELAARARAILERHHAEKPLEKGLDKEALRAELRLGAQALADLLERAAFTEEQDALVRLKDHRVTLSPAQEKARTEVMSRIEASFSPPPAKELGADPELIRSLVQSGELVKIGDFFLSAAQASELRTKVRDRIQRAGPQTVAEIRDLLGTTRRYAVPICEWLDATGATKRQGDVRALGPKP